MGVRLREVPVSLGPDLGGTTVYRIMLVNNNYFFGQNVHQCNQIPDLIVTPF